MPENESGQEKTEQATPKRREEAREKGQVAKSLEISSVAVLVICLIYFYFSAAGLMENLMALMKAGFSTVVQTEVRLENIQEIFSFYVYKGFLMLMPIFLLVLIAALGANLAQVGVLFSAESITPKFSKIDPIKGLKRLFSLRSLVEFVKTVFKIAVIGAISYLVVRGEMEGILLLMDQSVWDILIFLGRVSFKILFATCWLLLMLAALDYIYQRYEHEKSIKMTKEEVKQEFKNIEGDPIIKARIKKLQREIARKRMMAAVPKADVVITNPVHLAIAIKYDHKIMPIPRVIAKGAGVIAEKIKEIARDNDIPIVENKSAAQVLYATVEINEVIPEALYRAVAEILAYVYRLKGKDTGVSTAG